MITTLTENEALPELVGAFTKYAKSIYDSSHFEENYVQLMEEYKKWKHKFATLPESKIDARMEINDKLKNN